LCARVVLPLVLLIPLGAAADSSPATTPLTDPGSDVQKGREQLASYRWRVRTEMKVDEVPRIIKIEEVHIAPDGSLAWDKTVRYERQAAPPPLPYGDPRRGLPDAASEKEEDLYFEQGYALVQLYARVSPDRVNTWAKSARIISKDPDRADRLKITGRGLGRSFDEAVVYLDAKSRQPVEIEVKTTVTEVLKEIAFLRVQLEPLNERPAPGVTIAPRKVFLNMNRGKHRVVLEMAFTDFRKWG
jgi:hypothetical protein